MRRTTAWALAGVFVLAGCGSTHPEPSPAPVTTASHSSIDLPLARRGVDAQLIQSLSETAQSAGYDRDRDALTSWRTSQDLALLALKRCDADRAGSRSFDAFVADDVRRGISEDAAQRVNRFIEEEFCPALTD